MKRIKLIIRALLVVALSPFLLLYFIFMFFGLLAIPLFVFPIAWVTDDEQEMKEVKEDVIYAFLDFRENIEGVISFVKNKS